jgi:hypothetical protein
MLIGASWLAGTTLRDDQSNAYECLLSGVGGDDDLAEPYGYASFHYSDDFMCACTDCHEAGDACTSAFWKTEPCPKIYVTNARTRTGGGGPVGLKLRIVPICEVHDTNGVGMMGYVRDDDGKCAVFAGHMSPTSYFCP